MRKLVHVLVALLAGFQVNTSAQQIRAEFDMARFVSPIDGPYLETYLKLKGNSLQVIQAEDGLYSEVVLSYLVKSNRDTAFYDIFKLHGPTLNDESVRMDFIDVQRIPLDKGDYELTLTIKDVNSSTTNPVTVNQPISIRSATNKFKERLRQASEATSVAGVPSSQESSGLGNPIEYYISDILIASEVRPTTSPNLLSKSGKDIIPYASSFYPQSVNNISFYCEVYNTRIQAEKNMRELTNLFKDRTNAHKFLIQMSIEASEDGKIVQNLASRLIRDSSEVIPVLHTFNIENLPTGNYNLAVELRDFNNELLDRRETLFQRVNEVEYVPEELESLSSEDELEHTFVGKYNRIELLEEYIRCLHPISSQEEIYQVNQRINYNDAKMMKRFLYYFWKSRYPLDPEGAWLKYWAQVEKVNSTYSTNLRKGYDTDRGRVYLQYGPPNTISPNYFEPNTYPYEIWHYYVLVDGKSAEQTNRRFVFANIGRGNSEFTLIHSDAKNEITNARWNHDLHNRSSQSINFDVEDAGGQYGGRSKDFFENPY